MYVVNYAFPMFVPLCVPNRVLHVSNAGAKSLDRIVLDAMTSRSFHFACYDFVSFDRHFHFQLLTYRWNALSYCQYVFSSCR